MSYDLKAFYDSVDELTTRDRALSVMYGRNQDANGGGLIPINVDAAGNIQLGGNITLNVSEITPVVVVQPTGALLNATVALNSVSGSALNLGQNTMANSLPFTIASNQTPIPVQVTPTTSSIATLTNVSGNLANTTILVLNLNRRMVTLFNDSLNPAAVLYLKFGLGASTSSFTAQIPAGSYYEFPLPIYTGEIDGLWSTSASATARVTEFT